MAKLKLPKQSKRKRHYFSSILVIFLLILITSGIVSWWIPIQITSSTTFIQNIQSNKVVLPWPSYGESAIGAVGYGVVENHGPEVMLPTASVAKLITVMTVLKQRPIALGQQGPTITLGDSDVASYMHYSAIDGSVVKVASGEQITEYQAIQAMLLPSANNMADSLAIWAFGSLPAYVSAANQFVTSIGLSHTIVSNDASGFLPNTKSTASDLVTLGQYVLGNPVVKQIVGQKQATIPVAGQVNNVNWLLGQDGIIGIKTGNTTQAGGVYVFAANDSLTPAVNITIIGAIMDGSSLKQVLSDSLPLLNAAKTNFQIESPVKSGEVVGYYKLPWANQTVAATAQKDISLPIWNGSVPKTQITLDKITAPLSSGSVVGLASISQNGSTFSTKITLNQAIGTPPPEWRIFRHKL